MKLRLFFLTLLLLLNYSRLTIAQGGLGLSFLILNPSTRATGLGWTGVSNSTDDPLGFYYNPAMLGYSSQHSNISIEFNPGANDWTSFADLKYSNYGFNIGYNFKNLLRETILLEVPSFAECEGGSCPKRKEYNKYLKESSNEQSEDEGYQPFADLDWKP